MGNCLPPRCQGREYNKVLVGKNELRVRRSRLGEGDRGVLLAGCFLNLAELIPRFRELRV